MIGGAAGGLYLGIMGVGRYTSGSPGLLALPGYIGDQGFANITHACIGAAIGFLVSFIVCLVIYRDEQSTTTSETEEASTVSEVETQVDEPSNMDEFHNATGDMIFAPITGKAIALNKVYDPTFAEEILGKGVAIIPSKGEAVSPVDGIIVTVFDTQHAYGILADNGAEILIHIGIDTVQLEGKHFEALVQTGDRVTAGQLIAKFDEAAIRAAGYQTVTPIIISNTPDYTNIVGLAGTNVTTGDPIIKVSK